MATTKSCYSEPLSSLPFDKAESVQILDTTDRQLHHLHTPSHSLPQDRPSVPAVYSSIDNTHHSATHLPSRIHYSAVIKQEPLRARMCGFSNGRDRRLLNPPLIVQAFTHENNVKKAVNMNEYHHLMCHVSLWSEDGRQLYSAVRNPRASHYFRSSDDIEGKSGLINHLSMGTPGVSISQAESDQYCDIIIGTSVVKSMVLRDLDKSLGLYFVFSDLGIRSPGRYTLRCNIMNMDS
ncbi:hypothetical protein BSLG_002549 [Batrachochytrium salamandrivorans]|nr:hypothetical protein BSLG_002549 [Batrachochytrium salamandrivorans]